MQPCAAFRGLFQVRVDQDPELVAAHARDFRGLTGEAAQKLTDGTQHAISFRVTVRVVDLLQVVHVTEEESEPPSGCAPPCERFVEHAGVQEIREEVPFGELAELRDVRAVLTGEPADDPPIDE